MAPRSLLLRAGALFLLAATFHSAAAAPRTTKPDATKPPAKVRVLDFGGRLDVNRLDLFTTNVGSIGYDYTQSAAGLFYPRGNPTAVLFASGLWIAGTVNGQERGALAEYSFEFGPGTASGGSFADPTRADFRSYKVRTHSDPADTAGWGDYVANAGPQGAPVKVHQLPDPNDAQLTVPVDGPDLPGDLALWTVFNDLDPLNHGSNPGGTAPLGVEVKQQVYGFDDPDAFGDVAIVDWTIRNASNETIDNAVIAFWSDPDLGGFTDDLVGWDSTRAMAYAYNGTNNDNQYGVQVPALGFVLLSGPGGPLAFARYVNGTDPNSITETIRTMHGLLPDGSPYLDPNTNQPTAFPYSGDPVAGSGWLDTNPADRRMLLSTGPVTLAPGEVTHVVYAIVVGQGTNRFDSVARLRCNSDIARQAFGQGFVRPFPGPGTSCAPVALCPRPSPFWANECAGPNVLVPGAIDILATCAATRSSYFEPPVGPGNAAIAFCLAMGAGATPRERAEREFLTMLANQCAGDNLVVPAAGPPIGLPSAASIDCPGVNGTTIAELLAPAGPPTLWNANYENNVATNPTPIHGVDIGGPQFGGGANTYHDFVGAGAFNPTTEPDSMTSVRIVFDAANPHPAYRYLRLEQGDGSPPTPGRGYLYGGYVPVPLYALDLASGDTLEVAFAERTVTDADGTILGPESQYATFDSTWSPSDSSDGGREYLVVYKRPQSGAPRPEFLTDGAIFDTSQPGLYVLAAARDSANTVFDDGDAFVFQWGLAPTPGVDRQLIELAAQPQGDAGTLAAYDQIASCLAAVNDGSAVGAPCSPGTPALATLIESNATSSQVSLTWFVVDPASPVFEVERRDGASSWMVRGTAVVDGTGRIAYVDRDVLPGQTLSYRLAQSTPHGRVTQGETTVLVPSPVSSSKLALLVRASTGGDLAVDFALPRAGTVRFEVVTAAGRRVYSWDAGTLDAGRHTLALPGSARLPGGFYLVRARQAGADAVAKALVLR